MFKELIEENLGIKDLTSYQEYKDGKRQKHLSPEDITQLSPDTIKSEDFWKWIDESEFNKDAVAFGKTKDVSVKDCNFMNHMIALESGCLNYFLKVLALTNGQIYKFSVLEIGAGFGGFQATCKEYGVDYIGLDVYPKAEGILPLKDGDTLFPDEVASQKFDIVYSSNVFQHLSSRQRESYYRQIVKVMKPGSVFSFNTVSQTYKDQGFRADGRQYMCHYGQYTEIQTPREYLNSVQEHFEIIQTGQIGESQMTFHCVLPTEEKYSIVRG